MKSTGMLRLVVLAGLVMTISSYLFADNITLSTYYPAPYGAYDRIQLIPREPLLKTAHCRVAENTGLMYYSKGSNKKAAGIYVCQKVSEDEYDWVYLSRPFSQDSVDITPQKAVCMKSDGRLGVCMNNLSFDGTCACS